MKIQKIDHVGIVVSDLAAAKAFFLDFGLELQGEGQAEGEQLDRVIGLHGVRDAYAFMRTPDGQATIELIQFYTPADPKGIQPAPANTLGLRHLAFVVEDVEALIAKLKKRGTETFSEIQYFGDTYKLCYIHGPEGIILELAEQIQ